MCRDLTGWWCLRMITIIILIDFKWIEQRRSFHQRSLSFCRPIGGQTWKLIWILHGTLAGFSVRIHNNKFGRFLCGNRCCSTTATQVNDKWKISGSGHQKAFSQKSTANQKKNCMYARWTIENARTKLCVHSKWPTSPDWLGLDKFYQAKTVAVTASRCRRCSLFSSRGRFSLRPFGTTPNS